MELRQFRYFDRIARYGSFSKAARDLGLAEPTLNEQITRLEREIGTPVFDRHTRPLHLTPAGEALQRRVRSVLAEVNELNADLAALVVLASGHVTIGAGRSSIRFMPSLVAEFNERYPQIELTLRQETNENIP